LLSELAAGDWWRRLGMFEHLRFCFNGFPLWCNDLIYVLLCDGFLEDDRPELGAPSNNLFIFFCKF